MAGYSNHIDQLDKEKIEDVAQIHNSTRPNSSTSKRKREAKDISMHDDDGRDEVKVPQKKRRKKPSAKSVRINNDIEEKAVILEAKQATHSKDKHQSIPRSTASKGIQEKAKSLLCAPSSLCLVLFAL